MTMNSRSNNSIPLEVNLAKYAKRLYFLVDWVFVACVCSVPRCLVGTVQRRQISAVRKQFLDDFCISSKMKWRVSVGISNVDGGAMGAKEFGHSGTFDQVQGGVSVGIPTVDRGSVADEQFGNWNVISSCSTVQGSLSVLLLKIDLRTMVQ